MDLILGIFYKRFNVIFLEGFVGMNISMIFFRRSRLALLISWMTKMLFSQLSVVQNSNSDG